MNKKRILFLSRWFPFPADNGSKLRLYNLLGGLSKHYDVTLLSFTDRESGSMQRNFTHPYCEEIRTVHWRGFQPGSTRAIAGYLNYKPRSIIDTYSADMAKLIKETLQNGRFDLVIASQVDMAAYKDHFAGYSALFDEVEIGAFHQQVAQAALPTGRARAALRWWKYQKYIASLVRGFHYCTVVSEPERMLLVKAGVPAEKIQLLPNSVDLKAYRGIGGEPERNTLIFPGSIRFYANHDAVAWFLKDIFPLIRNEAPEVQLKITGDQGDISFPHQPGVHFTGFLEDVKPAIASSWISLAPIRMGGGTRLKILESMSLGTPVVSTSKGAEGLAVIHNEHLLLADTPQEFAGQVIRLLFDAQLRHALGENGKRLVSEQYDWAKTLDRFLNLVNLTINNVKTGQMATMPL